MDAKTKLLIELAKVVSTLAPNETPELVTAVQEVFAEDQQEEEEDAKRPSH